MPEKTLPANLLKDNLADEKKYLPSFPRVMTVIHLLPGRMRLRIFSLKDNVAASEAFSNKIIKLDGIKSVECNSVTGSVLINFDAQKLSPILIISAAKHCFDFKSEMKANSSVVWHEIRQVRKAFDQALLHRTNGTVDLKALICLLLIGIIIRGVARNQLSLMPPPLNAVLWLYQNTFPRSQE